MPGSLKSGASPTEIYIYNNPSPNPNGEKMLKQMNSMCAPKQKV